MYDKDIQQIKEGIVDIEKQMQQPRRSNMSNF
jgi:hypothetical protein